MRDKFKQLFATLSVFVAAMMASLLIATPARAQDLNGCNDANSATGLGMLCLFDGTNYGKFHWAQRDLGILHGQCQQFANAEINVWSSIVINPTDFGKSALTGYVIRFWPNDNCVGTPTPTYNAFSEYSDPDLRTTTWGNVSNVWNSFKIYN